MLLEDDIRQIADLIEEGFTSGHYVGGIIFWEIKEESVTMNLDPNFYEEDRNTEESEEYG